MQIKYIPTEINDEDSKKKRIKFIKHVNSIVNDKKNDKEKKV